jgi:hypothetical protein
MDYILETIRFFKVSHTFNYLSAVYLSKFALGNKSNKCMIILNKR